uniref:Uncharacterized protein n=1 Tax=Arundo donax TaxID=35708 RepID=A0A0A9DL63_ARUDO
MPIPQENNQAPQIGQTSLPHNDVNDDAPIQHDNWESAAVKTKE